MKHLEGWVYLCGVNQEPEADIIIGLLNEEGIFALKNFPEGGQFLKVAYGLTGGVDIYVLENEIERATELLAKSIQGPDKQETTVIDYKVNYGEDFTKEDSEDNKVDYIEYHTDNEAVRISTLSIGDRIRFPVLIILLIIVFGIALIFEHINIF